MGRSHRQEASSRVVSMPKFVLAYGWRSHIVGRRTAHGSRQQRRAWEPAVRPSAGSGVRGPPVGDPATVAHKNLHRVAGVPVGELGSCWQMTERAAENLDGCGIVADRVVNSEPNSGFLLMNGAAP